MQDPQSPDTFNKCKLSWEDRKEGKHKVLWELHQKLIQMRQTIPALKKLDKKSLEVSSIEDNKVLLLRRWNDDSQIFAILNFNDKEVTLTVAPPSGNWQKVLDSSDSKLMGPGSLLSDNLEPGQELTVKPQSFVVYEVKA